MTGPLVLGHETTTSPSSSTWLVQFHSLWEWVDTVCLLKGSQLSHLSSLGIETLKGCSWKRRPNLFTTRAAWIKKRLPACLLSLSVKLLDSVSSMNGMGDSLRLFRTGGVPCAILFKPGLRIFVVCFVVIPVTLLVCLWADTQQTANHYIIWLISLSVFIYNRSAWFFVENYQCLLPACLRLLIYIKSEWFQLYE